MWPAYFFISWIPILLNAIQPLWEQQRLAVFTAAFAPCLSHLCEVKTFTFHSEDTIRVCTRLFSWTPDSSSRRNKQKFPFILHIIWRFISGCCPFRMCPSKGPNRSTQATECQHKRVHQAMEVSSLKWLLRPTCALWSPSHFMQRANFKPNYLYSKGLKHL